MVKMSTRNALRRATAAAPWTTATPRSWKPVELCRTVWSSGSPVRGFAPVTPNASPWKGGRSFAAAAEYPPHQTITMPALSPTMTQGAIAEWKVAPGAQVKAGDVIADIETDKATMALESMEDGWMAKILVEAGAQDVQVGEIICVMVEEQGDCEKFADFAPTAAAPAAPVAPVAPAAPAPAAAASPPRPTSGDRVFASPKARVMAKAAGIDIALVNGTGPNGRVVMSDVQNAIETGVVAIETGGGSVTGASGTGVTGDQNGFARFFPAFEDVNLTNIKKITAARLTESKQTVPHFYLSVDVRMDALSALRAQLNEGLQKAGGKISVNDFVVSASAKALLAVPEVNASWMGDKIRRYKKADVAVAVQTPQGLMVPVVRGACGLGLSGISGEVKALAGKAKEGKLAPADMIGGTFTISNLGMFGVKNFAAIVNPPQAAILAVGAARVEVVKKEDGTGYEEASVMNVTLSCDHRVIDGADGATWLGAFKGFMEDPVTMLL